MESIKTKNLNMTANTPIPSASCLVLRPGPTAIEVLMLGRNSKLDFAAGAWVFPGGKIETEDQPDRTMSALSDTEFELEIAKRAAIRETREESGLEIDADRMLPISHWTTPDLGKKRFSTWFFVTVIGTDQAVQVDGSEIVQYRWLSVSEVLERHRAGKIQLRPPTFVSLLSIAGITEAEQVESQFKNIQLERFAPRLAMQDDYITALYHKDAGYEATDPARQGSRHRLEMRGNDWCYLRDIDTA